MGYHSWLGWWPILKLKNQSKYQGKDKKSFQNSQLVLGVLRSFCCFQQGDGNGDASSFSLEEKIVIKN
jgi:hypothetical protein